MVEMVNLVIPPDFKTSVFFMHFLLSKEYPSWLHSHQHPPLKAAVRKG
jgi:hypothetical protein